MKHLYDSYYKTLVAGFFFTLGIFPSFAQMFDKTYQYEGAVSFLKEDFRSVGYQFQVCDNNKITSVNIDRHGIEGNQSALFAGSCSLFRAWDGHYYNYYEAPKRNGDIDVFLDKLSEEGTLIWSRNYGSDGKDIALGFTEDDGAFGLLIGVLNPLNNRYELELIRVDAKGFPTWRRALPTIYSRRQRFQNDGTPIIQTEKIPEIKTFKSVPEGGFIVNNVAEENINFPPSFGNRNLLMKVGSDGVIKWTQSIGIPGVILSEFQINDIEGDLYGRTFLTGEIIIDEGLNIKRNLFLFAINSRGATYQQYLEPWEPGANNQFPKQVGIEVLPTFDNGIVLLVQDTHKDSVRIVSLEGEEGLPNFNTIRWEKKYPNIQPTEMIESIYEEIIIAGQNITIPG